MITKSKNLAFLIVFFMFFAIFPLYSCDFGGSSGEILQNQTLLSVDDNPVIKWEGRYEYKEADDVGMVYLYNTATGFTVDFVGTTLKVTFFSELAKQTNKAYYNFALDDEMLPNAKEGRTFNLSGGEEEKTLVSHLSNTKHTIKCLKMSEPADATTAVVKMETDGHFVARDLAFDESNLRFMFVCASGGSGHGSLSYSESTSSIARTTKNSSSLHAFNYLTARMFEADTMFVAQSGWGVKYPKSISSILDYTGITTSNTVAGAKTTALWDHESWVPDVIIFNIGGNDTTADGFNETAYKQEVVAMVQKLHTLYPDAKMIWTHTNSNAGRYAMAAISDVSPKINYVVEAIIPAVGAGETGSGTYGANGHNSIKTHIDTAQILANIIGVGGFGFTKLHDNITFEDVESMLIR